MCNLESETIDFLLKRDYYDINTTDSEGHSVLHYAVVKYSLETVIKLLKHGADVNLRTKEHKLTALHFAAKKKHNVTIVESLIKAGAIIESLDIEELSPLHMSVLKSSSDVVQCLIKNGADVNCLDKNLQFTPLHLIVYQQRRELFELLIEKGADVNRSGKDGFTPLHLSAMLGCSYFTEELLNHGAEVDCLYKNEFTPLHLATRNSHLVNEEVKITDAIGCGNENGLIVKLMKCLHDISGQDYEAVIHLLIRNGADVNTLTTSGWSSLHFVAKLDRNADNLVKIFLQYGAKVDCKESNSGFTPLHFALKNNNKELIEILIDAGADVNTLTKDGKSPLHLALENNCKEVLKLLVRQGAKLNCKGKRCLYTFLYIIARNDIEDVIDELQDFEKTLYFRVIDNLKNIEIKKAIMCLGAIVDASNDVGCMNINSEIESDYADSSKSLRINRVNVHDTEIYSKFACDRVLSGAIRDERKPQYVYDYLSMLNAVKLPLVKNYMTSRTQSIANFYTHHKLKTHFEICSDEVEKLKDYMINDKVSLYSVLHMRPKRRRRYMTNLNLCEIESEFEIYYKLVLARYREDLIKKALMDTIQLALFKFVDVELPIICVEEIFADLGVMNMIAIIEAADMGI